MVIAGLQRWLVRIDTEYYKMYEIGSIWYRFYNLGIGVQLWDSDSKSWLNLFSDALGSIQRSDYLTTINLIFECAYCSIIKAIKIPYIYQLASFYFSVKLCKKQMNLEKVWIPFQAESEKWYSKVHNLKFWFRTMPYCMDNNLSRNVKT